MYWKLLGEQLGAGKMNEFLSNFQKYMNYKDIDDQYSASGEEFFSGEHFMALYQAAKGEKQFDAYKYAKDTAKDIMKTLQKAGGKVGDIAKKSSSYFKIALFAVDLVKWTNKYNEKFDKFYAKYQNIQQCYDYIYNFYNRLNLYLQRVFTQDAPFELKVGGQKDRYFNYYGTNNKQTWSLNISMKRTKTDNKNMYSPAGEYVGNFTLDLTHDMTNFNNRVWDLGLLEMNKGYFSEMMKFPDIYQCTQPGHTYIRRTITNKKARIYIADNSASLVEGRKNKKYYIDTTFSFGGSDYEDYPISYSTKSMHVHINDKFAQMGDQYGAAAAGDVDLHLEGNENGTFHMISDTIYAEVASVFGDIRFMYQDMDLGEIHDANIWKPIENKTARIRIAVKANEEAFK